MPRVWSDTVSILIEPGWRFAMQGIKLLLFIAAGVLIAGSLQADIYEWTDENGVKHFTNYAPPDDATILIKTEEVPYDEAADRARMEADKQYERELAMQEIAAREAELQRREAEAERNAAAAERYAEETMREADQYLEDSRNDRWYYRGGAYLGGYLPSRYRRSFYRNETASIYWVDRPHIDHYRNIYRKKSRYRHSNKYNDIKYRFKKRAYPQKYRSAPQLRPTGRRTQSAYRVHSRGRGQMGRGHISSGFYRRRR